MDKRDSRGEKRIAQVGVIVGNLGCDQQALVANRDRRHAAGVIAGKLKSFGLRLRPLANDVEFALEVGTC